MTAVAVFGSSLAVLGNMGRVYAKETKASNLVGKQENIKRFVDSLQEMQQYVMREIAGQLKSGDFSLSGDSYQELRRDYLALVVTVVDVINVAAYLFDKTQDRDKQHWKDDLEWDEFRNALEIQGNDLGSGKV